MTELEKAARQALEALELHAEQYPHMQKGYTVDAITALLAALEQPAQQEPVAICEYCEKERPVIQAEGKPWVHATTWRGLTDEEIEQCMKQAYATVQGRNLEQAFARAIEAKLKEKNHG